MEEDTKIPNACTVAINKEDHTLANMLRSQLFHLPYVIFAAYKVPHPLEPRVLLKVQTDGQKTPLQAVEDATERLIVTLDQLKSALQTECMVARYQT